MDKEDIKCFDNNLHFFNNNSMVNQAVMEVRGCSSITSYYFSPVPPPTCMTRQINSNLIERINSTDHFKGAGTLEW